MPGNSLRRLIIVSVMPSSIAALASGSRAERLERQDGHRGRQPLPLPRLAQPERRAGHADERRAAGNQHPAARAPRQGGCAERDGCDSSGAGNSIATACGGSGGAGTGC